jgi:hypothetical protein
MGGRAAKKYQVIKGSKEINIDFCFCFKQQQTIYRNII